MQLICANQLQLGMYTGDAIGGRSIGQDGVHGFRIKIVATRCNAAQTHDPAAATMSLRHQPATWFKPKGIGPKNERKVKISCCYRVANMGADLSARACLLDLRSRRVAGDHGG